MDRQSELPVIQQCKLLELSRSSFYYRPAEISEEELKLMKAIDLIHLRHPFMGSRRIKDELVDRGITKKISRKKIQRLMRKMGIMALYPKQKTSIPGKGHKIYSYLLKGLAINRSN